VGLELGADDYLSKPQSRELVARIRAGAPRRTQPEDECEAGADRLTVDDVVVRPRPAPRAPRRRRRRASPPWSSRCSELLMRAAGTRRCGATTSRGGAWAATCCPSTAASDVHVSRMRKKLGPAPGRGRADHEAAGPVGYLYYARRRAERKAEALTPAASSSRSSSVLDVARARLRWRSSSRSPRRRRGRGAHRALQRQRAQRPRAARRWRSSDRDGPAGVARFLDQLERTTHVHARLLDADGRDVAGRVVPPRAIAVAARALDNRSDGDGGRRASGGQGTRGGGQRRPPLRSRRGVAVGITRSCTMDPFAQLCDSRRHGGRPAAACYGPGPVRDAPAGDLRGATRALPAAISAVRRGIHDGPRRRRVRVARPRLRWDGGRLDARSPRSAGCCATSRTSCARRLRV